MSFTRELFIIAVAVCALIAYVTPSRAQDVLIETHVDK